MYVQFIVINFVLFLYKFILFSFKVKYNINYKNLFIIRLLINALSCMHSCVCMNCSSCKYSPILNVWTRFTERSNCYIYIESMWVFAVRSNDRVHIIVTQNEPRGPGNISTKFMLQWLVVYVWYNVYEKRERNLQ